MVWLLGKVGELLLYALVTNFFLRIAAPLVRHMVQINFELTVHSNSNVALHECQVQMFNRLSKNARRNKFSIPKTENCLMQRAFEERET